MGEVYSNQILRFIGLQESFMFCLGYVKGCLVVCWILSKKKKLTGSSGSQSCGQVVSIVGGSVERGYGYGKFLYCEWKYIKFGYFFCLGVKVRVVNQREQVQGLGF